MAIFLMVAGGMHGGWCYDPIVPALEQRGHLVLAPDPIGMSSADDMPAEDISLAAWAKQFADLARAQSEPVILCGHSRSGFIISQAAEEAPGSIAALVYITALLAPSCSTINEASAQLEPDALAGFELSPEGNATTISLEAAKRIFYNTSPAALAEQAHARLVREPIRPLQEPLMLSEERFGSVPRYFIECIQDNIISLATQRAMQERLPCTAITLDCDHSPFLSAPSELADALDKIATKLR